MIPTHGRNGAVFLKENRMNDPIYISGKCHYASITEPNTKFDPVWSIQIEVDDGGDFVTIKRKVLRKDGTQRQAPIVKDSQNNLWDGKLVANGSVVNVKAIPFEWNYAGKSGVSADLAAVQVVDFIEYSGGGGEDFAPVEGGYVQQNEAAPF